MGSRRVPRIRVVVVQGPSKRDGGQSEGWRWPGGGRSQGSTQVLGVSVVSRWEEHLVPTVDETPVGTRPAPPVSLLSLGLGRELCEGPDHPSVCAVVFLFILTHSWISVLTGVLTLYFCSTSCFPYHTHVPFLFCVFLFPRLTFYYKNSVTLKSFLLFHHITFD